MDQKVVRISSANRDMGGTPEDFTITDPNQTFINNPKSVKAVRVTIPYTWYNVDSNFGDTMAFTGTVSGAHSIVLPPNNYIGSTLAMQLATDMTAVAGGETYTVVYDDVTNKFTISSTETFTMDFTVPQNMHAILGFDPVALGPAASSWTSTNVAGFVMDKSIWVCSDLIDGIDNGVIDWTSDNPPKNNQVLAEIPITGCFNTILQYCSCPDLPFYPITNSKFSRVDRTRAMRTTRFYLKFPSGADVLLNGQEWEMTVIFDFNKPVNGLLN